MDETSNHVPLEGLIGNDILQHFDSKTVNCMAGRAIEIPSGLIPFGNSEHFLYPGQVGNFDCVDHIESNFKTIVSEIECPQNLVNFCIEPKLSYEDVFAPIVR